MGINRIFNRLQEKRGEATRKRILVAKRGFQTFWLPTYATQSFIDKFHEKLKFLVPKKFLKKMEDEDAQQ